MGVDAIFLPADVIQHRAQGGVPASSFRHFCGAKLLEGGQRFRAKRGPEEEVRRYTLRCISPAGDNSECSVKHRAECWQFLLYSIVRLDVAPDPR